MCTDRQALKDSGCPVPLGCPYRLPCPVHPLLSASAGAAFGGHFESLSQGFGVQGRREGILVVTFRGPLRLYRISGFLTGEEKRRGKGGQGMSEVPRSLLDLLTKSLLFLIKLTCGTVLAK